MSNVSERPLYGKVALVTAAGALEGRGMGRAICLALGARGATVVASDIDGDAASKTAEVLTERGVEAAWFVADVTDRSAVEELVTHTKSRFGSIDVLINHAGFGSYHDLLETDDELWRHMIDLNLTSTFLMCRAVVPHMLEQGGGSIVNTVSTAGIAGGRAGTAYTAAKHGLVGLIKSIAFGYGAQGIRCNGVAPGTTRSGPAPQISPADSAIESRYRTVEGLLNRVGSPSELAEVIAFLASPESSFVNGAVVPVDGGYSIP